MGVIGRGAESSGGPYISFLGYSRTGKTTRMICLSRQLAPDEHEFRPCHRVTYHGQTRNICVGRKPLRNVSRFGEIVLTYLDYPGQDHVSAYYVLSGIASIIDQLRGKIAQEKLGEVLENLKRRAIDVAEAFLRPDLVDDKLQSVLEVIRDPFAFLEPDIRNTVADAGTIARTITSAYLIAETGSAGSLTMEEGGIEIEERVLSENLERLKNLVRNSNPRLGIDDAFNLLLCELEVPKASANVCVRNGGFRGAIESFDISESASQAFLHRRFRMTGPLIAYLALGLLLKSRAIVFPTPIDKAAWYGELLRAYMGVQLGAGTPTQQEHTHLIPRVVAYLNRGLLNDDDLLRACDEALPEPNEEELRICARFIVNLKRGDSSKAIDELKSLPYEIRERVVLNMIGESFRSFHFNFIRLLLMLLKELSKDRSGGEGEGRSIKDVLFLLTYHDNLDYPDSLKELGGDRPPSYFRNLREMLKDVKESMGDDLEVHIYMIPSAILTLNGGAGGGTALNVCTGVEAAILHCLLEGSPTGMLSICRDTRSVRRGTGQECETYSCGELLAAFKYDNWSHMIK